MATTYLYPIDSIAQSDTLDYSFLKFGDVYSYYSSNQIDLTSAQNPDLLFEVFDWLGTPYYWGGKSKNGVDCSGFSGCLYNKIYGKSIGRSAGDIYSQCEIIDATQLVEGDFIFFNIGGKYLSHIGVYLQNRRFAHATTHGGVMVNSLDEDYYKRYFYRAARLKDQ